MKVSYISTWKVNSGIAKYAEDLVRHLPKEVEFNVLYIDNEEFMK